MRTTRPQTAHKPQKPSSPSSRRRAFKFIAPPAALIASLAHIQSKFPNGSMVRTLDQDLQTLIGLTAGEQSINQVLYAFAVVGICKGAQDVIDKPLPSIWTGLLSFYTMESLWLDMPPIGNLLFLALAFGPSILSQGEKMLLEGAEHNA